MSKKRSIYAFRHVIFDMDGTLIDSVSVCIDAFARTLTPYGISYDDATTFYRSNTGQPPRQQYVAILESHDISPDERQLARFEAEFNEAYCGADVAYIPKAPWLVHALRRRGTTLFLSTASPDHVIDKRLKKADVGGCFALMLGSTALPKGQAHVDRFISHTRKPRDVFQETTAFCGDGETDMRIAREAGLYAIGVLGAVSEARLRAAGADRVVASVTALYDDRR